MTSKPFAPAASANAELGFRLFSKTPIEIPNPASLEWAANSSKTRSAPNKPELLIR
jgi:hypothetical protein